ncbi:hypothetical protein, partial [Photobacterium leiognathi]|uniref:hypothetical protein n=1 Tax=Photobacterium leiognathi TaxID=553611 RepID=UPI002981E608
RGSRVRVPSAPPLIKETSAEMLRFFVMCDPKKRFASWFAALAVRVESYPLRHLFKSPARNSGAFLHWE